MRGAVVDTDKSGKAIENDTVFVDAINDVVYIDDTVYGDKSMQTETVIFSTKADARRVRNRLADHGILAALCDREVRIEVPRVYSAESVRALALRVHNEVRG